MKAKNLSDIKIANKSMLYDCIRKHRSASISDLEFMTQLSRPTVTGLVRAMEAEGTVIRTGLSNSSGGRSATLYSLNANAHYAMGVDLEFPSVSISITNLEYECILQRKLKIDVARGFRELIQELLDAIENVLADSGIPRDRFLGVCIGIPGQIDRDRKYSTVERIPGWRSIPLGDIVAQRLNMPVHIENDANLLAWAEYRKNSDNPARNRLFIILRHGIGMGVIMDGHLLEGTSGNAGRIGHASINADGPLCVCGNRGCLSLYASEHAIVEKYQQMTGSSAADLRDIDVQAEAGDQSAIHVMSVAGRYLGTMILSLTSMFDIFYVTVCTKCGARHMNAAIQQAIERRVDNYRAHPIELHTLELPDCTSSLGGCMYVIDDYIRKLTRRSV